jgi:3D (Asp-Asp-Asp) domain-containing protein
LTVSVTNQAMPILALMGFSLFVGAAFPAGTAVAPEAPVIPSHPVTLTAYNAVPGQTDENPFETASGAYSNPEVVAARSADLADELPFGTIIELDGSNASKETCGYSAVAPLIGYRVIEDTMNPRYTYRLDVLFDTKANFIRTDGTKTNAANVLGICKGVTYHVVGHVDINHIPKTQAALVALIGKTTPLALK